MILHKIGITAIRIFNELRLATPENSPSYVTVYRLISCFAEDKEDLKTFFISQSNNLQTYIYTNQLIHIHFYISLDSPLIYLFKYTYNFKHWLTENFPTKGYLKIFQKYLERMQLHKLPCWLFRTFNKIKIMFTCLMFYLFVYNITI